MDRLAADQCERVCDGYLKTLRHFQQPGWLSNRWQLRRAVNLRATQRRRLADPPGGVVLARAQRRSLDDICRLGGLTATRNFGLETRKIQF